MSLLIEDPIRWAGAKVEGRYESKCYKLQSASNWLRGENWSVRDEISDLVSLFRPA